MTSKYIFKVKVFEGRDLIGKDKSGSFSYPYILVSVGPHEAKTKALKSLNPVWNEDLTLEMNDIVDNVMFVRCVDKSKLSASDFMGKIEIPLQKLIDNRMCEDWFALETNEKREHVSGHLHVSMEFIGEAPKKPLIAAPKTLSVSPRGSTPTKSPSPIPTPTVTITPSNNTKKENLLNLARSIDSSDDGASTKSDDTRGSPEREPEEQPIPIGSPARTLYAKGSLGSSSLPIIPKDKKKFKLSLALSPTTKDVLSPARASFDFANIPTSPQSPRRKAIHIQVKLNGQIILDDMVVSSDLLMSEVLRIIEDRVISKGIMTQSTLQLYNLYFRQNKKLKLLKKHKSVGHYKIPQHGQIEMMKPESRTLEAEPDLPFDSYYEKFDLDPSAPITDQRTDEELLFEFALHCLQYPITSDAPSTRSRLVKVLEQNLELSTEKCQEIQKRVAERGPGKKSVLIELEHRLQTVNHNPFYNRESFKGLEAFDRWKKREIKSIRDLINQLIFSDSGFSASMIVKVIQGRANETKLKEPYCILKLQQQTHQTKPAKKSAVSVWNETFEFFVQQHEEANLVMELWDEEKVAALNIPLDDLKTANNGNSINRWFIMDNTASIHLEIEYNYHYSRFVHFAQLEHPPQTEGVVVDQVMLYDQLTKILIEELYGAEDVITLSTESNWLLLEYALRYGIDHTYTKLAALKYMHLHPKRGLLNLIEDTLADALDCNVQNMTSSESSIYLIATQQMLASAQELLMKYKVVFPRNTPAGCFSTLIEITMLLYGEEQEKEGYASVSHWMQMYMEKRFKTVTQSLQLQRSSEEEVKWGSTLTPRELLVLIAIIQEEISNDAHFKDSCPRELDLMMLSTKTYYTSIGAAVQQLVEIPEYPPQIFELYFKLKEFRQFILSLSNKDQRYFKFLEVDKLFVPYVFSWLKESKDKISTWVSNAIQMDTKLPVSSADMNSSSVVDVFSALTSALQFLQSLEIYEPFFIIQFAEIVAHTVQNYTTLTAREIEKLIGDLQLNKKKGMFSLLDNIGSPANASPVAEPKKKEKKSKRFRVKLKKSSSEPKQEGEKSSPRGSITPNGTGHTTPLKDDSSYILEPELCIQLNNMESTRVQLDKMATILEENLDEYSKYGSSMAKEMLKDTLDVCLRDIFRHVREEITRMIGLISKKMNLYVQMKLTESINDPTDTSSEQMFSYLDESFSSLLENLYPELFKKVLQSLWIAVIQDMTELVQGDNQKLNYQQSQHLIANFESLREYFHADGSGLPDKFLAEKSDPINKILELCEKPTKELMDLYAELKSTEAAASPSTSMDDINAETVKKLLRGRDTDKDAKAFMTELDQEEYASPGEKTEHQKLREHFLLPDSELILDKYLVASQGKTGHLLLTTSYVLFDAMIGGGADQPYQLAIPLKDISSITRNKKMMLEQIEILSPDGKTVFTSVKKRKGMIQDIINQAHQIGNKKLIVPPDAK